MNDKEFDRVLALAHEQGEQDGRNAAEWYAQDAFGGRVTRGASESARLILQGIEEGDPAILDTLPSPDLSGQWADTTDGPTLYRELCDDAGIAPDDQDYDAFSDVLDAYRESYSQAVEETVSELARKAI